MDPRSTTDQTVWITYTRYVEPGTVKYHIVKDMFAIFIEISVRHGHSPKHESRYIVKIYAILGKISCWHSRYHSRTQGTLSSNGIMFKVHVLLSNRVIFKVSKIIFISTWQWMYLNLQKGFLKMQGRWKLDPVIPEYTENGPLRTEFYLTTRHVVPGE